MSEEAAPVEAATPDASEQIQRASETPTEQATKGAKDVAVQAQKVLDKVDEASDGAADIAEPANGTVNGAVETHDSDAGEKGTEIPPEGVDTPSEDTSKLAEDAETSSKKSVPATPIRRRSSSSSLLTETAGVAFLKDSFEKISTLTKKKNPEIVTACNTAIESLNKGEMPSEAVIFEPLKLACEQKSSVDAKIVALDTLSKIFTFNIFNQPIYIHYKKSKPDLKTDTEMDANVETVPGEGAEQHDEDEVPLVEAVISVISGCFEGEGTNHKVELQVLRVLMGAVVNESMPVHGKVLLQAMRQIYNIFLLSLSPVNQSIAQAALIQIISTVFNKCSEMGKRSHALREGNASIVSGSLEAVNSNGSDPHRMTLQDMEVSMDNDVVKLTSDEIFGDEEEQYVKDAFLIVRSMSNLAAKTIESKSIDMRSHAMRSKLLSLYIVYFILKEHPDVFLDHKNVISRTGTDKTTLIDGIRKYICLVLTRNATSQVNPVYEATLEIFAIMLTTLRSEFKYEIPVFWDEIYFPVSEMKTSSGHQKRYLLDVVHRFIKDPQALLELYLNYDCDPSLPNLTEKIVDYLTRYALARVDATPAQKVGYRESLTRRLSTYDMSSVPELNVSKMSSKFPDPEANANYPVEYALKMVSIDSIVDLLKALNTQSGAPVSTAASAASAAPAAASSLSISEEVSSSAEALRSVTVVNSPGPNSSSNSLVDGSATAAFETIKHKKNAMLECVKLFSYSPKKGIKAFIKEGFIPDDDPQSIARFLRENGSLDKAALGEYLGEGHDLNVAIMHYFIDSMDFKGWKYLDALRFLLQQFRLPGESQKIDRFMLKFAEKYVNDNPDVFRNADTAYVLSYSVVMLNTDQHNPDVKNPMTLEEFIKNNAGIDDGQDLDPKLLEFIYNDIRDNEIIINSEQQQALISKEITESSGLFGGRDLARETYLKASKEMSSKTEQVFKNLRSSIKDRPQAEFFRIDLDEDNSDYVRSLFDNLWMSLLAALTPPFKEYDDEDIAKQLLLGMRISIHLACIFDNDYSRTSFMRALVQFTDINNPEEIKQKNIQAVRTLFEIVDEDKNVLKNSWKGIFIVISQLERLRLLSKGVDSSSIPNLMNARLANRNSIDSMRQQQQQQQNGSGFFGFGKKPSYSEQQLQHYIDQKLSPDAVAALSSTSMDVALDKVFAKSSEIKGNGIFDFIAALSDVARIEIDSSGQSDQPRTFSLQKLVDVCYYNMSRVRVEWSALWAVLNDIFNEFGCHSNPAISFFAIDSLRQLSEQFFAFDELSHFKFQKEFLQPFNYIMANNPNLAVRDMVLDCVHYLVAKKSVQIRSGWTTLLEILTSSAADDNEQFVDKGFNYVDLIAKDHFDEVFKQEGFDTLIMCLAEYAKNDKFQKTSLRALHEINGFVEVVSSKTKNVNDEEKLSKMWFPVLFGFYDVIMEGDDLEVRSKALNYMFDALVKYGGQFGKDFWYRISKELLFPIFSILSQHWQLSNNQEDLWVWLSSTLIQALRRMISLFTTYYDMLSGMLDGYLGLLVSCICQENETISKVGISCLEDLILENMDRFGAEEWNRIDDTFKELFDMTKATELFDADPLKSGKKKLKLKSVADAEDEDEEEIDEEDAADDEEDDGAGDEDTEDDETLKQLQVSRQKSTIVIKCVLQLHMIQTLLELFDNDNFYDHIPVKDLLILSDLLKQSYEFARDFNEDYNLRVRLWNSGVMDKLPNLLKQETSAVGVFISIMFRVYCDSQKADAETRRQISDMLIPLSVALLTRFVGFDEREHARNIASWTPVIVETLQACTEMDEKDFGRVTEATYGLVMSLFDKGMTKETRRAMKDYMTRVGTTYISEAAVEAPKAEKKQ